MEFQPLMRKKNQKTKTEDIIPIGKPDAFARDFFIRDYSTLAATCDTCCHSHNLKKSVWA